MLYVAMALFNIPTLFFFFNYNTFISKMPILWHPFKSNSRWFIANIKNIIKETITILEKAEIQQNFKRNNLFAVNLLAQHARKTGLHKMRKGRRGREKSTRGQLGKSSSTHFSKLRPRAQRTSRLASLIMLRTLVTCDGDTLQLILMSGILC